VQALTGYRVDLHESSERQYHLHLSSEARKVMRFRRNAQGARVSKRDANYSIAFQ